MKLYYKFITNESVDNWQNFPKLKQQETQLQLIRETYFVVIFTTFSTPKIIILSYIQNNGKIAGKIAIISQRIVTCRK